ncbi:hypothetical protein HU200_005094 [Digitaria exilis]|uniref:ACT domain-containing protein n=1 Tax=Digitaria exilis TaxID=1010633 RepID=A0A835KWV5_9POAL|nr:hypothetical protein HU200_005094 [Digitaria exilis]CAB3482385.1 unnamed protein product [Digitaria exilis]
MPAPVSPPPPPPPQHREAEGSPPDLYGVAVQRISDHLRRTGQHGDDLDAPTFAERLARHLRRLRSRYLFSYLDGSISAEDVLLHLRILDDCADPDKRPVFHARLVGARLYGVPVVVDGGDDRQELLHEPGIVFRHEIVFSSVERPRVLSRLTALVSEVGLNILGAGIYNTVDGFCLFVFLVDGWESKVNV